MAGITFTEASGVNDSVFGKSQYPIRMFIEKRGEALEQESMLKEIYYTEKSTKFAEKMTAMTGMDGFEPVGENGDYPDMEMQESFSKVIEHEVWKGSFSISREIIDDEQTMDLRKQPEAFIASYYRRREDFGAALLGNAIQKNTSMTYHGKKFSCTCADNLCLFSKVHPSKLKASRTQSNLFADQFSVDALSAMESRMNDFRGDVDEILDVTPTTILIPNDWKLKRDVLMALGATKDPDTANNGMNAQYGKWNVIVWPYLNRWLASGVKPWVMMDKRYNELYGSAVWFDRKALEVRSEIAGNDANVWKGYSRFSAGFNDWRGFAVGGIPDGTVLVT